MKSIYSIFNIPFLSLFLLFSFITNPTTPPATTITGFTPAESRQQLELEKRFDTFLSADRIGNRIKRMSAEPNNLGSPYQHKNALYIDSLFTAWGFDSQIVEYKVLLPTPKERVLEMVSPTRFKAKLSEPTLAEDATSSIREGSLPPYVAYSGEGDVTAELVYVNQGVPADYEELEKRGISVKGKIVIARYGGSWRGIKPKLAYEHGAVGCIIYSDPIDDGYGQGDTYPEGSWRPEDGVQRGSVMDMPVRPGDPLTPMRGATKDAKRLSIEDSETILKIPVLPISYADALPLLEAMDGPVAPPSWRGALPITYHMGPGTAKVRLKVTFNWDLVPLYNVVATMKGTEYPDQWVLRGNHMDGWVFGAADPLSGNSAMMEEAYALGQLAKSGWRPKRTIKYASWDGEEQGLLGSTEWVEDNAKELREKAVIYINTDGNSRGFLGVGGSHSLQRMVNEVGDQVIDPQTGVTVNERSRARQLVAGNKSLAEGGDLSIYPLGSGSDYSPFLQHLGISSLNISYGGEGRGGAYHSRYDSYDHYRRFGDPGFEYGVALSKTAGRTVLRFANASIMPHHYSDMAENIKTYLDEVKKMTEEMRGQTQFEQSLHRMNAFNLAADPTQTYHAPTPQTTVPFINFTPLENAVAQLAEITSKYDKALKAGLGDNSKVTSAQMKKINTLLISMEQNLTNPEGLPRRPWFRHQIYAPGYYTGYGVKTIPGVREAVEQRNWEEVSQQVTQTAAAITRYSNGIAEVVKLME
ncbi:MAG: M28 family metallopeptidase [Balneolaceae bacterium]